MLPLLKAVKKQHCLPIIKQTDSSNATKVSRYIGKLNKIYIIFIFSYQPCRQLKRGITLWMTPLFYLVVSFYRIIF